jgi:hypothetical protein
VRALCVSPFCTDSKNALSPRNSRVARAVGSASARLAKPCSCIRDTLASGFSTAVYITRSAAESEKSSVCSRAGVRWKRTVTTALSPCRMRKVPFSCAPAAGAEGAGGAVSAAASPSAGPQAARASASTASGAMGRIGASGYG